MATEEEKTQPVDESVPPPKPRPEDHSADHGPDQFYVICVFFMVVLCLAMLASTRDNLINLRNQVTEMTRHNEEIIMKHCVDSDETIIRQSAITACAQLILFITATIFAHVVLALCALCAFLAEHA